MGYFLQGLMMGFAYVAPIGLQNMFLINAALANGLRRTLLTAAVVIFFDISLALACFWGVGAVMQRWEWLQLLILLLGSLIVLWIGWGLLRERPGEPAAGDGRKTLRETVGTACVVTWFNPQALIDGTMMLGAFNATLPDGAGLPFIGGVCSASCLWFGLLACVVNACKSRLSGRMLRGLNVVCGVIIMFYGCKLLYNFVLLIG